MNAGASPYVLSIKNWMIRSIIERYLQARDAFLSYLEGFRNGTAIPFEYLMELSDRLFAIKEDNYLIFRRVLDPKNMTFEDAPKLTPNEAEVRFMNNVGLIFHKVMVARELKYVMEHYQADSEDYEESLTSLTYYLGRIEQLFANGLQVIRQMIAGYGDNTVLLVYFLENREYVERTFGLPLSELLAPMLGNGSERDAYLRAVDYYLESGRPQPARRLLKAMETAQDRGAEVPPRLLERLRELEQRFETESE